MNAQQIVRNVAPQMKARWYARRRYEALTAEVALEAAGYDPDGETLLLSLDAPGDSVHPQSIENRTLHCNNLVVK